MRIGIHIHASEPEAIVEHCRQVGVNEVLVPTAAVSEAGRLTATGIDTLRAGLAKGGVALGGMILPIPSANARLGRDEREVEMLCGMIRSMGEAGIETALFYPLDERAHAQKHGLSEPVMRVRGEGWTELIQFFNRIIEAAEDTRVHVANHVWNVGVMKAILAAAPSPYNGVTYCQGMYVLGKNPYDAIKQWGAERIHLSHARNLVKHGEGWDSVHAYLFPYSPYEEVPLDKGDIDVARCIGLLYEAGWDGLIAPEHLAPAGTRSPAEIIQDTAEGVQYLKGILEQLGALTH